MPFGNLWKLFMPFSACLLPCDTVCVSCARSCPHLDRVLVLLSRRTAGDSWVTGVTTPASGAASGDAPAPAPAAESRTRGQVDQIAVTEVRRTRRGCPVLIPDILSDARVVGRLYYAAGTRLDASPVGPVCL